jgi:hypothetical protein
MRSTWFWSAVSLLCALTASPATIERQTIVHVIDAEGQVSERTELVVRLDTAGDLEQWSSYYIVLDRNRTLRSIECSALRPDGSSVKVPKRKQDRRGVTASHELHSSRELHEVIFPATLPAGSTLHISHEVAVAPYFPSGSIALTGDDQVTSLRVEVRGGGGRLRWNLEGTVDGIEISTGNGALVAKGSNLAATEQEPVQLRYAWGPQTTWADVGIWYEGMLRDVERGSPGLHALAEQLINGSEEPRQRLAQLLAFVRNDVRYVAVEVGIGGYQPSPPAKVLERRWGDCKDKSLLLVSLLETAGIEAFPALIRLSMGQDIDRSFPVPDRFNHMIVAVPSEQLVREPLDPVAGGYLFLDPTQERGGLGWLHPADQSKGALVVRAERSALVVTPDCSSIEGSRLLADIELADDGSATGTVELLLSGASAYTLLYWLSSPSAEEAVRELLAEHLAGAQIGALRWGSADEPLPLVRLNVAVSFPSFIQESRLGPSLRLPEPMRAPNPSTLDNESEPVGYLGSYASRWSLHLPAGWSPAEVEEIAEENLAGKLRQTSTFAEDVLVIERLIEIRAPAIEPAAVEALSQLYLAEQQTKRRRLRFPPPTPVASSRSWPAMITAPSLLPCIRDRNVAHILLRCEPYGAVVVTGRGRRAHHDATHPGHERAAVCQRQHPHRAPGGVPANRHLGSLPQAPRL